MKDLDEHKKIAVLIDADNAQKVKVKLIIQELSAYGHIVVKRAYGDWSTSNLKNWKKTLNELAIQPIQQFSYTTGKNATDASMIIDAMDLLYSNKFDAFALVSSDSDFTKLASRLRESEMLVFGVGEKKTPIAFRNACDDFIYTENLKDIEIAEPGKTNNQKSPKSEDHEIIALLKMAWQKHQDDDGWTNISPAGSLIKRNKPDFDPKNHNANKLSEIIERLPEHFEMKKKRGKGTNIIAFRVKG